MQRSGTTLLEKVLSSHPAASLLSQPFPFLFLHVKRRFFRGRGQEPPPYPLGPLFRERTYSQRDLLEFLAVHTVSRRALEEVFSAMEGYSGQYTKFDQERLRLALESFRPGDMAGTMRQLYHELAHDPEAAWCGGKETLCEELLPFVLDRGLRAVLILRDPRDVLASLNHGQGSRFAGAYKPTLFNIRHWRKSVAFALHLEDHPNFLWLRYEDLVVGTGEALERLTSFLGIAPFEEGCFTTQIPDRSGKSWTSNSSHGAYRGISGGSIGRYKTVLPEQVSALIEAVCRPELRRLDYPFASPTRDPRHLLEEFREPYPLSRAHLERHMPSPQNVHDELVRLALVDEGDEDPHLLREYFVFEDVHQKLRSVGDR